MSIKKIFLILLLCSCVKNNAIQEKVKPLNFNINEVKLENNLLIRYIEDSKLPIVVIDFKFKSAGRGQDLPGKEGLAKLTLKTLHENIDSSLQKRMDVIGTNIKLYSDLDDIHIVLTTQKNNLIESAGIVKLILTQKTIDDKNLLIAKDKLYSELLENDSNSSTLANKKFKQIIFANSSYRQAHNISKDSISSITKEDILNFINNNFRAENLLINIVGEVNEATIKSLFANFELHNKPVNKLLFRCKRLAIYYDKITIIDKDFPQADIVFGQNLNYSFEDQHKVEIINYILGGRGLSSRLMQQLRELKGYTYGVHTHLDKPDSQKIWIGSVAVENQNVYETIKIIKEEVSKLSNNGITSAELQRAKNISTDGFILNLDTNYNIAHILSKMNDDIYSNDYFVKRISSINNITLDEINDFAKNILSQDELYFVVVGKEELMSKVN